MKKKNPGIPSTDFSCELDIIFPTRGNSSVISLLTPFTMINKTTKTTRHRPSNRRIPNKIKVNKKKGYLLIR
jgi:hypothetical protein